MKQKVNNIGIDAQAPSKECEDPKCPWHGTLPVRGKVIEGTVVSARGQKGIVIERAYLRPITKYERYERRKSRVSAYRPECIEVVIGDRVRIAECRPLSKTKAFVLIEKIVEKKGKRKKK